MSLGATAAGRLHQFGCCCCVFVFVLAVVGVAASAVVPQLATDTKAHKKIVLADAGGDFPFKRILVTLLT